MEFLAQFENWGVTFKGKIFIGSKGISLAIEAQHLVTYLVAGVKAFIPTKMI